jgi:hypothetical protein
MMMKRLRDISVEETKAAMRAQAIGLLISVALVVAYCFLVGQPQSWSQTFIGQLSADCKKTHPKKCVLTVMAPASSRPIVPGMTTMFIGPCGSPGVFCVGSEGTYGQGAYSP